MPRLGVVRMREVVTVQSTNPLVDSVVCHRRLSTGDAVLWGFVYKMWHCACCLRCKFTPEEIEQRRKSQEIDKMLEKDKQSLKRQVKLLLLGAGESGKSTFLKQMRIIHGLKFEYELVKEYQQDIYQNVIRGMKVLVDARDKLGISWEDNKNNDTGRLLLQYNNTTQLDPRLFNQYAPFVARLWKDSGIRRAFDRRREFQLVSTNCFNNP